ncbi:MAG: hypothetical protein OHK93_001735 [Ramalina farinacea]|uniref:Ankyrin repeat domain-containing protein n=1 Tax=Ramalina farinacea TaxID=258253 RepID=A0AA43TT48_9LECA|nr:hypothetical protein [Ramalina farinacea]
MLVAACNAKQPETVQFLLQKYPTTETSQKLHEAAMAGGIPVYEIILSKYPELKDHGFGHTCDPIGQAVVNGDLDMLKFLLNQGFDIQMAHFCYIPVLTIAIGKEASEEMIEVLKQHGAPEGQELPALNPSFSSGSED